MIEKYSTDQYGIVHQLDPKPFAYCEEYVNIYNQPAYKENELKLSYLRLGYLLAHTNPTSLLDVGFGNGAFLRAAEHIIPNTYGYDVFPNPNYRIAPLTDYYDVITFFDSLEHFPSLDFFTTLRCKYVLISTPWMPTSGFDGWKHRKPNEHLHFFTPTSLSNFLVHHNFTPLHFTNLEDVIRKSTPPNILTLIARNNSL